MGKSGLGVNEIMNKFNCDGLGLILQVIGIVATVAIGFAGFIGYKHDKEELDSRDAELTELVRKSKYDLEKDSMADLFYTGVHGDANTRSSK